MCACAGGCAIINSTWIARDFKLPLIFYIISTTLAQRYTKPKTGQWWYRENSIKMVACSISQSEQWKAWNKMKVWKTSQSQREKILIKMANLCSCVYFSRSNNSNSSTVLGYWILVQLSLYITSWYMATSSRIERAGLESLFPSPALKLQIVNEPLFLKVNI